MNHLRGTLFLVWLYAMIVLVGVGGSPWLGASRARVWGVVRVWVRLTLWGLRHIAGVTMAVRGSSLIPTGPVLVAAKHQSMLDIIAPILTVPDACYVLKQELMRTPIVGWYCKALGMIGVDRDDGMRALKTMLAKARIAVEAGRPIVIFPEGTRQEPGAAPDYKPGVAALYRDLDLPCVPLGTNSGSHWPAHGPDFKPGVAVFEFLDPIPAGLKRPEFMAELESRIERSSNALLETA